MEDILYQKPDILPQYNSQFETNFETSEELKNMAPHL